MTRVDSLAVLSLSPLKVDTTHVPSVSSSDRLLEFQPSSARDNRIGRWGRIDHDSLEWLVMDAFQGIAIAGTLGRGTMTAIASSWDDSHAGRRYLGTVTAHRIPCPAVRQ